MEAENEQDAHRERLKRFLESLSPEERMAGLTPGQILAGLTPEQILAGLTPEERMAGLSPEQILLGLPVVVLRAFSESYLATLPESVREAIRKRLGR